MESQNKEQENHSGENQEKEEHEVKDIVTSFVIQAASDKGVDYDKLIKKFGCFKLEPEMIDKFQLLTG